MHRMQSRSSGTQNITNGVFLLCVSVPFWLSLLAGCGESSPPTATLRISNWLNAAVDPTFFKLERELESEYEAAHPGVDMRIEPIPGVGQYAPKLLLQHAANAMPDAGYLDASSGAAFMNNGVAADLTPLLRTDPAFH